MTSRILALVILLGAEVLIASIAFDGEKLLGRTGGLLSILGNWGAWAHRWALGAAMIFAAFAFLQKRINAISSTGSLIRPPWLLGHVGSFAAFWFLSKAIYSGPSDSDAIVALWAVASLAVALTAACAVAPAGAWIALIRQNRSLWIYSAVGSGLACGLGWSIRYLWAPVTATTFAIVKFLLSLVLGETVIQPAALRIGTPKFTVIVTPECSGLEGVGLFLIFGVLWLILFRDEIRFPHALVLLPAGMATLYLLNAVRIAVLVLIGNAGWRDIAVRGFHSQAGWIAFNCVAFALLLGARRISWISARESRGEAVSEYPAAPYLIPFLAILAAGFVSGAMTAHFEWLYSLRLIAAAWALWIFRHRYRGIDWRFGWPALGAGCAVFAVWVAVDWAMGSAQTAQGMPAELANSHGALRFAWLAARVAGAVVAVPIAEELAFRGFGLRRLIDGDFEAVSWRSVTAVSLGGSAILFGVLHGGLWLAGIVAGLIYGLAMVRRGRLGESVGAHATTNALLAAYVLATGRWDLW